MSDGLRYICKAAPCDHERKDANHWFLIWLEPMISDPTRKYFASERFSEERATLLLASGARVLWVCGQHCAQKMYELFLQTGGLDPVKSPASHSINPKPGSEGSHGNESSGSETGIR